MRPTPANAPWLLPILASAVAVAGCRLLGPGVVVNDVAITEAPVAVDARQKPAARTIHLEVLFVRCNEHDKALCEEIWTFVDERALSDPACRALNANGLRAGIVTGHLPSHLAERFASNEAAAAAAADIAGLDATLTRRLLQLLPGKRSEIVTASRLQSVVLLEQCDGEVRGSTFHDVTAEMAVEARPAADGRVRIEAVPPEEFLIDRRAKSIADATLVAHRSTVPAGDLIAMGYDPDLVAEFAESADALDTNVERLARNEDATLNLGSRGDEAMKLARFLANVVGKAHARQMDEPTRLAWQQELDAHHSKTLEAPSWLWASVVDLLATHEKAYLEHCRVYATEAKPA